MRARYINGMKKEVRAYFASMPPKARAALKRIRIAVRSAVPRAEEAFSYRNAAFKNHCSLYPITGAIRRRLAVDLKGYETSKGTVRLPLAKPIPVGLVRKLVKARVAEARKST